MIIKTKNGSTYKIEGTLILTLSEIKDAPKFIIHSDLLAFLINKSMKEEFKYHPLKTPDEKQY